MTNQCQRLTSTEKLWSLSLRERGEPGSTPAWTSWRTWWCSPCRRRGRASVSWRRLTCWSWLWSTWENWRDSRCWQWTPLWTWTGSGLATPSAPLRSADVWPPLELMSPLDQDWWDTSATNWTPSRTTDTPRYQSESQSQELPNTWGCLLPLQTEDTSPAETWPRHLRDYLRSAPQLWRKRPRLCGDLSKLSWLSTL